jgi:hypothetical protein
MSIVSARAALEVKLNSISPAIDTAWENKKFQPSSTDRPYQRVYLLLAEPENPTLGDGFHRIIGILQVTLFYPLNTGSAAAATRAELIKTTFKRGTTMTAGGVVVKIDRTPEISPGRIDEDRFAIPVKIPFYADIQTT